MSYLSQMIGSTNYFFLGTRAAFAAIGTSSFACGLDKHLSIVASASAPGGADLTHAMRSERQASLLAAGEQYIKMARRASVRFISYPHGIKRAPPTVINSAPRSVINL